MTTTNIPDREEPIEPADIEDEDEPEDEEEPDEEDDAPER